MILREAVLNAQEKYFKDAQTDADYLTCVMDYYKSNLHVIKMSIGGFQNQLASITNKYANVTDDESVKKWSREIHSLFSKKKIIKNPKFDAMEYLAVTYIAGSRGTDNWTKLMLD